MEKRKKEVEERVAEMDDVSQLIPGAAVYPSGVDVNQSIAEYYSAKHDRDKLEEELRQLSIRPENVLRFLERGRVVRMMDSHGVDWGYGVVTDSPKKARPTMKRGAVGAPPQRTEGEYIVNVLLQCDATTIQDLPFHARIYKPCLMSDTAVWDIAPCKLSQIKHVTQVLVSMLHPIPDTPEGKAAGSDILKQVDSQLNGAFPVLDPIEHMKIEGPRILEIVEKLKQLGEQLDSNQLCHHELLIPLYEKFDEKVKLNNELRQLQQNLEARKHLVMRDDLRAMRRVLRKLEYLDDKSVVTVKGRAACEVSSVDELVMCELLFQNIFHNMDNQHLCAMLSCFVFDEKSDAFLPTDQRLLIAYERVRDMARHVAEVSAQCKLPITVTEYVDKFKPVLMDIVLKWMNGAKFADLQISEDLFEGSVVRAMRRLEELLRQLACAAKSIGEQHLETRFSQCIQKMRRGIIFSASLYL